MKYQIDCQPMDVEFRDSGPWRSYELHAEGDTLDELIESAQVSEIDQDGGEICTTPLAHMGGEVERVGEDMLRAWVRAVDRGVA